MTPALSTDGLRKVYRKRLSGRQVVALRGLSLHIAPGEIFGLLGPNGAGKTTLLKLLLGIVRPTGGAASLFGIPIADPRSRAAIGFLPENHRFPPFLTARQALRVYGRLSDLRREDIRSRTDPLLDRVGLAQWADVRIREFSKGMMQRLGLAQALLNHPKMLFLDEPTDGVDPIGRREIRELLTSLAREEVTIFLNSHLLSEVEMLCTRVGILHRGRLIQAGTVSEVTGPTLHYRIRFDAADAARVRSLAPELIVHPDPIDVGRVFVVVNAPTTSELNEWIDRFRGHGLLIVGIVPDQKSLEARFMEIIESLEEGDPGAVGVSRNSDPEAA